VVFDLPAPYGAAERLFDGFAILPRQRLERTWREGRLGSVWGLDTPPSEIAGLGPFRFKEYAAGRRLVLERNPYYWKNDAAGHRLPYLDEVRFVPASGEDLQVLRFQAGESDLISRISSRNFEVLGKQRALACTLFDAGPGLEYSFLFFNLNELPPAAGRDLAARGAFFRLPAFRRAVSLAVDRDAMVRLVYGNRATALSTPVPAGDTVWINEKLPRAVRSVSGARQLLSDARFTWAPDGALLDPAGTRVEFSIATSVGNAERIQMATLIQDDLKAVGMAVHVVPLEMTSLLTRVTRTHDYEACLLSLAEPDADPNTTMSLWLSSSANHLWHPGQQSPATAAEARIDFMMRRQMTTRTFAERKRLYDEAQQVAMEDLSLIPLVTPHILTGARESLSNVRPAVMDHYVLWNLDEIWIADGESRGNYGGRGAASPARNARALKRQP
jgi:peptide/nickel transport system substrate-binding protein